VRATARQHERIREFLDRIMGSARRQVMIEATIVEVDLSDRFQQGIDWSLVRKLGSTAGTGLTVKPAGPVTGGMLTGGLVSSLAQLTLKKTSAETDVTAALKLLESFGTLRVLSSPKISVLNSQTSLLKVVDNEVYFTITVTAGTAATATTPATQPTYSSTLNTVPIGFLMTVTPQISDNGEVILNLRPTISRISGYAMDPNPILAENNLTNPIPIVQTREMESVMRVQTGDIAILGGLMQDSRNNRTDETPLLNRIPYLGELFKFKDNTSRKSELVVFLRPTVLTDASLDGDFRDYRKLLPAARARFDAPAEQPRVPAP
jgi:MSHA biogenesis protein MshL